MAKIKGVCKNYDECDLAASKEVQEAEKTNFVCSECGKPLYPVKEAAGSGSDSKNKLIMGAVAAVVVVAGAGIYFGLFHGNGEKSSAAADTTQVAPVELSDVSVDSAAMEKAKETVQPAKNGTVAKPSASADQGGVVTKDLGYAVWVGKVKNGKPNDVQGTLTFKSSHVIDSRDDKERVASPGDKVIGTFENGHLTQGRWYKSDGNVESIILGSVD
ncbi:MAG: hypothetical protein LKI39_02410 [Bacteroides sp.]|jgi:ssDNA-binding Zn-finger/Zn-ribbon topoisomerase 1|nr:hypothetical protein [Bacteroides sp.]MCI1681389.1 hypothetical protein [Bacteroides sp.]